MVTRANGLVPVRMKVNIDGEFHGVTHPRRGDVVDVEPGAAQRYYKFGYCQPAEVKELGGPYREYIA